MNDDAKSENPPGRTSGTSTQWVNRRLPGWHWHYVAERYQELLESLHADDPGVSQEKKAQTEAHYGFPLKRFVEEGNIDLPGMMFMGRSYSSFRIEPGFALRIPNTDVGVFYDRLKAASPRYTVKGVNFYRLYGYLQLVLLDEEQRWTLLAAMEPKLQEAEVAARADDKVLDDGVAATNQALGREAVVRVKAEKNDPLPEKLLVNKPNRERN